MGAVGRWWGYRLKLSTGDPSVRPQKKTFTQMQELRRIYHSVDIEGAGPFPSHDTCMQLGRELGQLSKS